MRPLILTMTFAALTLSGCAQVAESRFNPLNWFGSSSAAPVDATGNIRPLVTADMITQEVDARIPVASITALEVSPTPEGAIIRATGIADRQGVFNAQLVPVARDGATLVLAFRVEVSAGPAQVGPTSTRQVTVARVLSNAELAGLRTIRVDAATNARLVRR